MEAANELLGMCLQIAGTHRVWLGWELTVKDES